MLMSVSTAVEKELKMESEGIRKLATLYHAIDHSTRLAIMKLTKTPVADAVTPNARMSVQTVAASRSTIAL